MRPLLAVALFAFAALVLIWATQRRLMYFPDREVPPASSVGLTDVRSVTIPVEDGTTLGGWFVAAPRAMFTVLVFNGNAGNRAYRAPLAAALRDRGFNVLLFDYRGFGDSSGAPTEAGLAADARAVRTYVVGAIGIDAERLVYFGESLGAGVATSLAAAFAPAALVLRSPFTSMTDVGRHHYPILPVRMLLRDRYDSLGTIERVHAPVLVIAGDRDAIVPLEQSRRLFERIPGRKKLLVVPGADHNDAELLQGPAMMKAIVEFVGQLSR